MEYNDFDRDFPDRCMSLLRNASRYALGSEASRNAVPSRDDGRRECAQLLAIGCALLCTHYDRAQVPTDGRGHITRPAGSRRHEAVDKFLKMSLVSLLAEARHEERAPESAFEPKWFERVSTDGFNERLHLHLIEKSVPIGSDRACFDVIQKMRSGLAHGNAWPIVLHDVGVGSNEDRRIAGFVLANTLPTYEASICEACNRGGRKSILPDAYTVAGIVMSTLDFYLFLKQWTSALRRDDVGRVAAGGILEAASGPA